MELMSPNLDDISWDGTEEKVTVDIPTPNGPELDLSTIMIPINTRTDAITAEAGSFDAYIILKQNSMRNYSEEVRPSSGTKFSISCECQ